VGRGTPVKCLFRDPRCTCSHTPPWYFLHPHVLPLTVPIRSSLYLTRLPQNSDKRKSYQTTKPRKTAEREATRRRRTTPEEHKKRGNDLALSADVRSLGQRNASGDLLSTNLGLSLASTSRVDRVDRYNLNRNGIGPSSFQANTTARGLRFLRHGDCREPKGLRVGEVPFSLNPYTIILDENQERVERGEKRRERRGGLLPIHTPWQEMRHWKGATHKEHECPSYL